MRKSWKKLAIAAMLLTFAACSVNGCKKSGNNDSVKAAVQEAEKSDEDRGKDGQFSAEVIDSAAFGTKLRRTGYSDAWSRVSYNGVTCYISTQYVSTTQPETKAEKESGAEEKTGEGTAVSLNPSWNMRIFQKSIQVQRLFTNPRLLTKRALLYASMQDMGPRVAQMLRRSAIRTVRRR